MQSLQKVCTEVAAASAKAVPSVDPVLCIASGFVAAGRAHQDIK